MSFAHTSALNKKGDRRSVKKQPPMQDTLCIERQTQTSKTILQLAKEELEKRSLTPPDIEGNSYQFVRKSDIFYSTENTSAFNPHGLINGSVVPEDQNRGHSLKKLFLSENSDTQPCSSSTYPPDVCTPGNESSVDEVFKVPQWSRFTIREIRVKSVDAANNNITIQDYAKNNDYNIQENADLKYEVMNNIRNRLPSPKRGRSLSPRTVNRNCRASEDSNSQGSLDSIKTRDIFHLLINNIKSSDWNVSLKALVEIAEKASLFEHHRIYSHMTEINQKLIEFLRSPRSQVCRAACQIAGKLFESIKDTRRPEFDDIVEQLLMKTADSNKFIRKDANLALDSLIMNISYIHTIRAITQKGPSHKNDLIRISSARLYVCIVGIAGVGVVLNHGGNEFSRQRIFENMVNFIKDRNPKAREYGVRLYRLMHDHQNFDMYLKKFVDKSRIIEIKKIIKKA